MGDSRPRLAIVGMWEGGNVGTLAASRVKQKTCSVGRLCPTRSPRARLASGTDDERNPRRFAANVE